MHILLGILGTVVTILILLNRLSNTGIDLGWLNPFLWKKRRKWRKMYEGNPVYKITSPMDATALLMVAAAKADGDMTEESKENILSLFEKEFHLSGKEATGLMISSVHLLGDGEEVRNNIGAVLAPSLGQFSESQSASTINLIGRVAGAAGSRPEHIQNIVNTIENVFAKKNNNKNQW